MNRNNVIKHLAAIIVKQQKDIDSANAQLGNVIQHGYSGRCYTTYLERLLAATALRDAWICSIRIAGSVNKRRAGLAATVADLYSSARVEHGGRSSTSQISNLQNSVALDARMIVAEELAQDEDLLAGIDADTWKDVAAAADDRYGRKLFVVEEL